MILPLIKNLFLPLFLALYFVFHSCSADINNLPQGELIDTVYSPDETYAINTYLVNGGATVDFSVRCEVVEKSSDESRNIYWEYKCDTADIEWIDDTTVKINGKELNVLTDSYDWRDR